MREKMLDQNGLEQSVWPSEKPRNNNSDMVVRALGNWAWTWRLSINYSTL